MIRAWPNCLAGDGRIFADIASESGSAFLSACLFVGGRWCSFGTLLKLNSITANNSDL